MTEILLAIGILGGLGLVFGLVLAAASRVFYVETDPRLEQLNQCLPGANCGGCGYAGCNAYAEAVLKGEAKIGLCASGGSECSKAMAAIMGVEAEEVTRKVALVRCSGEKHYDAEGNLISGSRLKAEYEGFRDCRAASGVGGHGPLSCKFGCLGFGTCVRACKYGAMEIVDGVAKVDQDLCVGCMVCANVCPRNLITAIDPRNTVVIACNSHAKGAVVNRNCTMGCMGCSLCKKICPENAITIDRNLAVIDYSKCTSCGLCATVCPKKLIKKNAEDSVEVEQVIKPLNGPDI